VIDQAQAFLKYQYADAGCGVAISIAIAVMASRYLTSFFMGVVLG
jgi:hypothetical protein